MATTRLWCIKNGLKRSINYVVNEAKTVGDDASFKYILDNEMKLLGKIENIAKGESIYAARYVGDMAYFITYRNTDPLFVADLSNAAKPKLLGEVKISGFSDYLHSDNK